MPTARGGPFEWITISNQRYTYADPPRSCRLGQTFRLCRDVADERGPRPRKVPSRFAVWRRSGATWALIALNSVHWFRRQLGEGLAHD